MEYQKITNLLDTTSDNVPRSITKKWLVVLDQSGGAEDRYKPSKQVRFKTSMLRSVLCDYSDVYFVVKGDITLTEDRNGNFVDVRNRFLAFKNNATFTNCISKINNVLIENAEDLDAVMSMYNLLEYSKYYRRTTESSWDYYREKNNGFVANNYNVNPITNSVSLNIKQALLEKHQMQITKMVKILSKKIQRLKKILKLLFH